MLTDKPIILTEDMLIEAIEAVKNAKPKKQVLICPFCEAENPTWIHVGRHLIKGMRKYNVKR